ncbi:hypothetical protein MKW94_016875, partial [Papaver nudicaule]|nr:hypothetical protein [Papaver nudicaule]
MPLLRFVLMLKIKTAHTETIKLQIGFKNYDPQKEKRFSGSVRLPHSPFGDAQHVEEVKYTV